MDQRYGLPARPEEELLQDTEDGKCYEDAKYDHFNMSFPQIRKEHCQPTTHRFFQKFTNSF